MKFQRRYLAWFMAFLAGGIPLATFATCDRDAMGGAFQLVSSNDDLVKGVFDLVFDEDDD